MRLNRASDFALRILILLAQEAAPPADSGAEAAEKPREAPTVEAIARRLDLPKSHVMKIVARLAGAGLVAAQRGRSGGVRLVADPTALTAGAVLRLMESEFAPVDCLARNAPACVFEPRCALKPAMIAATEAFLASLDTVTLEEIAAGTMRLPLPKSPGCSAKDETFP